MPTNLGHESISALKVGHENVTAGYVGHEQIFPNTTEITSLAYTDLSTVNLNGETRVLNVAGQVGSTFDIAGTAGATSYSGQTLTSSPQAFNVAIGSNNSSCIAATRQPTIVVTPTGTTQLASGVNGTLVLNQQGGPGITYRSATATINVTNTNRVVLTAGSNVYWAAGSSWDISWSVSSAHGSNGSFSSFVFPGTVSGTSSYSQGLAGSTNASGSFTFTLTYTYGAYAVPFRIYLTRLYTCEEMSPSTFGTYHYP